MFLSNRSFGMVALCLSAMSIGTSCTTSKRSAPSKMVVSVRDQRLSLVQNGVPVKTYPISTSKFGLGDSPGSNKTPIGAMRVHQKVGSGVRSGTVFHGRRPTGEIVKPNSPGRDPIVSRILWLEGAERSTKNARDRYIYIHGTPEETTIGTPASYGCIRMRSKDVIDLYDRVTPGSLVVVKPSGLRLAEVPSRESSLYAAVQQRSGGKIATPQTPKTAPTPANIPARPTRPPAFGKGSQGELVAAATPSRTPIRREVGRTVYLSKNEETTKSISDWQLSREQARRLFEENR
jgi:hypothetical protein